MTKFRRTLNLLAVALFTLTFASLAQAQATRTWVSGVGDDANPCSRTAPCKTFAGAISKTAASGEIDALDPGGFGTLTITKSITVDGAGTMASVLAALTNGFNVNDSAAASPGTSIVTLRNLSINGAGNGLNGINFFRGKTLHIENVEIFGFTQNGINAALTGSLAAGTEMFVDDVDIRDLRGASSIGIKLSTTAAFLAAGMDHVRIERVPTGVQVGALSVATIRNSVMTHGGIGVEMTGGNSNSIIENTMLTNNTTGIAAGSGTTTRISNTSILLNTNDFTAGGGTVRSSGNNPIYDNSNIGLTPSIIIPK
jgi:hypothetical protein